MWPDAPRASVTPASRSSRRSPTDPVRAVSGRPSQTSIPAAASASAVGKSKTPIVAGAIVGLVVAGAAVFWMSQKNTGAPRTDTGVDAVPISTAVRPIAKGTPDPGVLALNDLAEIAPLDVLPKARARARTWHANAVLVSIRAEGVTRGLLDAVRGGSLELEFGIPKQRDALGSRKPVGAKRFLVNVDGNGSRVRELSVSNRAVSVGDPDCPLPSAWHKMSQSGVPKTETVSFTYAARPGDQRTVWTAKVAGKPQLTRTLDGRECTILAN